MAAAVIRRPHGGGRGLPARDCWSGSDPEAAGGGVRIPTRRDARTGHRNRRVAPVHGPKARIGTGGSATVAQRQDGQRHAAPAGCASGERIPCTWPQMSFAHRSFAIRDSVSAMDARGSSPIKHSTGAEALLPSVSVENALAVGER